MKSPILLIVISTLHVVLAASSAGAATPGAGANRLPRVEIQAGPPPKAYETPGGRRPGYIWLPGYWSWSGNRFVWMKGRYVRSKRDTFQHVPNAGSQADGRYQIYPLEIPPGKSRQPLDELGPR